MPIAQKDVTIEELLAAKPTPQDVRTAYKWLFARLPETEKVARAHASTIPTVGDLRRFLISSPEFQDKEGVENLEGLWVRGEINKQFYLWADLGDRYVSMPCLRANFEPAETAVWLGIVKPGDAVLDIGANIGWYTLHAALAVGKRGRVVGFEPRPTTHSFLLRSIVDNGLDDMVRIHSCALSNYDGDASIHWRTAMNNPGHTWLGNALGEAGLGSAMVPVRQLDAVIQGQHFDAIKIDVEGAEHSVFLGASNLLERSKPVIMSEIFPEQLAAVSGVTVRDYIKMINMYGYSCNRITAAGIDDPIDDIPSDNPELFSVVFTPKS